MSIYAKQNYYNQKVEEINRIKGLVNDLECTLEGLKNHNAEIKMDTYYFNSEKFPATLNILKTTQAFRSSLVDLIEFEIYILRSRIDELERDE